MLIYVKNERRDDIEENIHNYLFRYQIYISGDIPFPNSVNLKMKSYLEDNYDLMCFNSKEVNEVKLVRMMGSRLMIVMFENNEIQNREINTARKLKIPILFIYNSLYVQKIYPVNKGEQKIVFNNLEDVAMILNDKFKLIKKIKRRKDLPFKTLENETKLFEFNELNSISILKEDQKLILAGDIIQSYNTNFFNSIQNIQIFEFKNGQINACVNNKDKEIIILNNRVFSKYFYVFSKYFYVFSKFVKLSENKISGVKDDVIINEIVVNEENKHVYGISNNSNKLFHFDEKFKLIQIKDVSTPLLIKCINNNLYMLLKGYGNSTIEGSNTSQIIENENSFIGVYSQKENEVIKFKRKIILDVLVAPSEFHVDQKYVFIFTPFINKHHLFDFKLNLFVFNHDGILLQKTGFNIEALIDTRLLVVDYQAIFCVDFKTKTFKKLEFINL